MLNMIRVGVASVSRKFKWTKKAVGTVEKNNFYDFHFLRYIKSYPAYS